MSTTCGCEHCHSHGSSGLWMPTVSFVLLVIGLIGKYSGISWFAESWIEAIWFLVAFFAGRTSCYARSLGSGFAERLF